jgi:hypothetical protein
MLLGGCSQTTDRPPAESTPEATTSAPVETTPGDDSTEGDLGIEYPDGVLDTPVPPKPGGP